MGNFFKISKLTNAILFIKSSELTSATSVIIKNSELTVTPSMTKVIEGHILTCELTNRKCICRNVNRACKIGWMNAMLVRHEVSIMLCIAISRPLKTSVPNPKAVE